MKFLILAAVLLTFCLVQAIINIDPDETVDFPGLVRSKGFILQTHEVTTPDGYILVLHRVLPSNYTEENYTRDRKPIIALHGIMTASNCFFINSPSVKSPDSQCGDNFGFGLVESGKYDLWAANSRGNGVSHKHVKYSDLNPRFWEFSIDEVAMIDIPVFLDYVREKTGHKTVGWVGWSQGAGALLAAISLKPELANYIQPLIAWAPGVHFGNSKSIAFVGTPIMAPLMQAVPMAMPFTTSWINVLQQGACRPELPTIHICRLVYDLGLGASDSFNMTRFPVYGRFLIRPSSNWQMAHSMINIYEKRFGRYKYLTKEKNIEMYGSATPPEYPLTKIPRSLKIFVFYGATDAFVDVLDVAKLKTILMLNGNQIQTFRVPKLKWSHTDMVIGQGAGKLVYDPTIKLLDQHTIKDGPQ